MEQITPQYKRGKYIRRRGRKKRIAIVCLCVAIVLAAAALLFFFREQIFGGSEQTPVPTDASGATLHTEAPTEKAADATEAPVRGKEVALAGGRLLLTYDDGSLALTEDANLTTLLEKASGAELPRMDIQKLPGKLGTLRDSELERIAIALMQAYYYHPPHTDEVELTVIRNDKQEFSGKMQLPAIDDAPAALCSVRLLAVGDELWAAVLLQPEGMERTALSNAFVWLTPMEDNG
ncbi:MAG: hypothetical protein IJG45_06135 [Oscillospiraceae bacterium]|nr:hypothetical protein [Oscillospiraceae bacterium]